MRCRAFPLSAVDLFASPELAVLAVLDAALEAALVALLVAYPDDELESENLPVERRAARQLLTSAHDLSSAIDRYRLALARARERDRTDDNPF